VVGPDDHAGADFLTDWHLAVALIVARPEGFEPPTY